MRVLEVGCGSGAYTTLVGREVGKNGLVLALDIHPEMLGRLAGKMSGSGKEERKNRSPVLGNAYYLLFWECSFDLVYLITVLHEIPDPLRALREIARVLRPGEGSSQSRSGSLILTFRSPLPRYGWVKKQVW